MADNNIIGQIPSFTEDNSSESVIEEVKQPTGEQPIVDETETPELPAEKPADELQALSVDTTESQPVFQEPETLKAMKGLSEERVRLLREISELKGQRRELRDERTARVQHEPDELKDLTPEDRTLLDRYSAAKGFITPEQVNEMFYKAVKTDEENRFFEKYPEYKVENDVQGVNWSLFDRELNRLKTLGWNLPTDPKKTFEVMEFVHNNIVKVPSGPSLPLQQRRVQVASAGAGGTQRPSPSVIPFTFDANKRSMLSSGGFSEEEIKSMEARQATR